MVPIKWARVINESYCGNSCLFENVSKGGFGNGQTTRASSSFTSNIFYRNLNWNELEWNELGEIISKCHGLGLSHEGIEKSSFFLKVIIF